MEFEGYRMTVDALSTMIEVLPLPPDTKDIPSLDITQMASLYVSVKGQHKALDEVVKKWYHFKEYLSKVAIPDKLEDMGLDKVQIPSLGKSFYPIQKYSASMPDKEAGYKWLRDNGGDELIKETVNAGSLTSFLRHRLEEDGIDPPDEIFNFNSYKITGMSSYTPK